MFQDHRIIGRHGAREILQQRQEILWNDGSHVWFNSIRAHGLPDLFTRATPMPGGRWLMFDLRQLVASLDEDLRRTQDRDVPGMVLYTLRGHFQNAAELRNRLALVGDLVTLDLPHQADVPVPAPSSFAHRAPREYSASELVAQVGIAGALR